MAKLWKVLLVLALGASVDVPRPTSGTGLYVHLPGPVLALILYGILTVIALLSVLNHLPGVFALRRPLGVVPSGYEYLWAPAVLTVLVGCTWNGSLDGREGADRVWTIVYGAANTSWSPMAALGGFAALMWSLKLRASMIEANRRLGEA